MAQLILLYWRNEMSPEYLALKLKIAKKRKLVEKHSAELQKLLATCPHEETVAKERYVDGSYYDSAHTNYWNQCTLCGEKSPISVMRHGWFG